MIRHSDGERIFLEPDLSIETIETSGHSAGAVSYFIREKSVLFTSDTISVECDVPIYIDRDKNLKSLNKLKMIPSVQYYCTAWDRIYENSEGKEMIEKGLPLLKEYNTMQK